MNSFRDAFRRAARNNPAFDHFQLYRKVDPAEYADLVVTEEQGEAIIKTGMYDWMETTPGALHWQDVGLDGKGAARGILTLYSDPAAPDLVLAPDGTWYVAAETLGADTLGAGYRLEVKHWPHGIPPTIRVEAP